MKFINLKSKIPGVLLLIFVWSISFVPSSFAQKNIYGTFGAPEIKFTKLLDQNAAILGGRWGWVINKQFVLGAGVYALVGGVNTNVIDPISNEQVAVNFNYGGLELEYILLAEKVVHGSIDLLIAGAGTYFSVPDQSKPHTSYYTQSFTLYEPQLNLEFNIFKWLHLTSGVSYRIITGFENYLPGITALNLEGLSGTLTFKFGSY